MTYRDDLKAAHLKIEQLENELSNIKKQKKKNKPIKQDNKGKNITKYFKKGLKIFKFYLPYISAICLTCIIITGLLLLIEPDHEFIADGWITKVIVKNKQYKYSCNVLRLKSGEFKTNCPSKKEYGIKGNFIDKYNKVKTFSIYPEQTINPVFSFNYHRITKDFSALYRGPKYAIPYIGCKVKVHYKVGKWFNDHSWTSKFVDISSCYKQ